MKRLVALTYGLLAYGGFLAVFLYLVGFLANFGVPRSVDVGPETTFWTAALINVLLVALFGLQHTVMARPTFKQWWTKFVPKSIERSTYVMASNLVLVLMFWQWRPMNSVLWDVAHPVTRTALWALFLAGGLGVVATTFLINHFDLFGARQVWLHFRGQEYRPLGFRMPAVYKFIRHPLYVGWITAFFATPTMTTGHLLFALGMTAYILIAIPFEERNLVEEHPEYEAYRRTVPAFLPRLSRQPFGERKNREPAQVV